MQNNDIFRKLRYIFDLNDSQMLDVFRLCEHSYTKNQIANWLSKDDHVDFEEIEDRDLAVFLNGLIIKKRGKREGPQPEAESRINNNIILRKLKIALNFKNEDVLEVLKKADLIISKHELSAFFRNPKQNQYRICKDQVLRNFLMGLQLKLRPN